MYQDLIDHVMVTYPQRGRLRSLALRKLADSLTDVLGHAETFRNLPDQGYIAPNKKDEKDYQVSEEPDPHRINGL